MHKNIIQHIKNLIDLSESEIEVFNKHTEIIPLKKKEYLLQQGKTCKHLYFVEKGCLKMYFISKKGTEQITQFAIDGWWISDYQSLVNNIPSEYYIQAVEESKILSIAVNSFDILLTELPQVEKYFRKMMQKSIAGAQLRSKLMYEMSKEEFYVHFSSTFPEFMSRVPQYMIASYLGLTPEYLSELRKK
ncbi:MAG: Crp/Fnr family transcriptional regulator [Bacteroidota bacterium]